MEKKQKYALGTLICIGILSILFWVVFHDRRTEITWYLTYPEYYGAEMSETEPYGKVESERFKLFNKRLKSLGIPAKVTFKYLPDSYEYTEEEMADGSWYRKDLLNRGSRIKNLIAEDKEADIVTFAPMEYGEFLTLDSYLEEKEAESLKKAVPEELWKMNEINGHTYQIPRCNVGIKETVYCFYKPFLEEYRIELNEEEIRAKNPKEVIEWLLPYFEEERVLDGRYYLTSAADLNYENYFLGKEVPIIQGVNNSVVLDTATGEVKDLLHADGLLEGLQLYQWIYSNHIDAHEEPEAAYAMPVFTIGDIATVEELQSEQAEDSRWTEISLGNACLSTSVGNGVLKGSDHPELAVRVLAASMYDEELSNLMIYGVEGKDYRLESGHAVSMGDTFVSSMGSFSEAGNNLIAYPNEKEAPDKTEISRQLLQRTQMIPLSNFIPQWDEDLLGEAAKLTDIYWEISIAVKFSEIPDLDAYLKEQEERLKAAGAEKLLAKLQNQAEQWEKSGDDF